MRKTTNYKKLIGVTKSNWQKFYEKTISKEDPEVTDEIKQLWSKNYFKSYVRLPITILGKPKSFNIDTLEQVLLERKSQNNFTKESFTLSDLSNILYYSAGMKPDTENQRFYPSAGARYPLEIYIIVQNVKKLKKGIYHYYVNEHGLEYLSDFTKKELEESFKFPWVINSSVIIVITAVFDRIMMKYGDRGYNYIFIEAGHLCQNVLLLAEKSSVGASPVGGFFEEKVNKLLDIDPQFESSIYTVALGKL